MAKGSSSSSTIADTPPLRKKHLVNGKESVFRLPIEESDERRGARERGKGRYYWQCMLELDVQRVPVTDVIQAPRILIHKDD